MLLGVVLGVLIWLIVWWWFGLNGWLVGFSRVRLLFVVILSSCLYVSFRFLCSGLGLVLVVVRLVLRLLNIGSSLFSSFLLVKWCVCLMLWVMCLCWLFRLVCLCSDLVFSSVSLLCRFLICCCSVLVGVCLLVDVWDVIFD